VHPGCQATLERKLGDRRAQRAASELPGVEHVVCPGTVKRDKRPCPPEDRGSQRRILPHQPTGQIHRRDALVYRVGDQLGAWSYTAIAWVGLGLSGLALTMVPLSAVWLLLALWLGARYRRFITAARPPASVTVAGKSGPAASLR